MKPYKFEFKDGTTIVAKPIAVTKFTVISIIENKTYLISRDSLVKTSKYAIKDKDNPEESLAECDVSEESYKEETGNEC